ncbi:NAD(+) diphosphatase [Phocaeicola paurosaccharolyticus]|jgi:NAD+ diphosphatase|uniref:NAD(+) diphosphatase n=1 Tax=Phocaeicola paurosaccharolyticus TaxID=732242 RepID=UPI002FE1A14B
MREKIYWFVFFKKSVLVKHNEKGGEIPFDDKTPIGNEENLHILDIATYYGKQCKAYFIDEEDVKELPDGCEFIDLRASYDILPLQEYKLAGRAWQILFWDVNTRFCPHCGVKTIQISNIGKKCLECNQEFYPNISPAIIVRIHKGDSILLIRAKNFRGTFNGLVAGFVEPGESLEETVEREVMEETGLKINNIKYFGSQSWPYPSGIMIGFIADYVSGEIKIQEDELTSAGFFTKDNLPEIPRKLSIARKLIDAWLQEK